MHGKETECMRTDILPNSNIQINSAPLLWRENIDKWEENVKVEEREQWQGLSVMKI